MKTILARIAITLALACIVSSRATAAEPEPTAAAEAAAVKWLGLVDHGSYAESWDAAASVFQGVVAKASWESSLKALRTPMGAKLARSLKSATVKHELPGVPDGDYVVIQFETRFEHKASATEVITPMKEKDGTWKVAGYFIQ